MSKFTEMFKEKATQIAITSLSACLVIGVSAGAIVQSNNKKLETALNELSNALTTEITESSSETTTENTAESTTESTTVSTTRSTTTTTTEPAGDRTIQYLAEYEKITREYEKKKAELEEYTLFETLIRINDDANDEEKSLINEKNSSASSHNEKAKDALAKIKELDEQYKKDIENLKREYGIIE